MQALVEPLVRWRTKTDDIEDWERVWRIDPSSVAITRTHRSDFRQRQLMITRDGERLGTFDVKPAASARAARLSAAAARRVSGPAPKITSIG